MLSQQRVLDPNLALRLEDMAGFRNLLVHRYGDVDNLRVLDTIKNYLDDVLLFEKEIIQYLENE